MSVQIIGEKISISTHSTRKNTRLSLLLRLLSNVLGVLDGLLHLIEINIYTEIGVNISPFILLKAQALKTLLVSERDAFAICT